jgi:hydrophobic/amphiphilic exporter-1 (mainly G- bacteria), HAE1 family
MQWLAEICVRRPVFATVLTLLIVVLGVVGYSQLGVDKFPNVDFPFVTITVVQPGAAPEDIETEITDRVEAAVNTIGDIEELRSSSMEGVSLVVVQFSLEKDVDIAAQDVRDRIGRITAELPADIQPPIISKMDPGASPIFFVVLKAEGRSLREITEVADTRVRESLEVLPGVGAVTIVGGQKRAIEVQMDPVRMAGLKVSAGEVARAVGNQNLTVPGGRVDTGPQQLTVRVHGKVGSPEEVGLLPVRAMGNHIIRVRDVATVVDGAEEKETSAIWDGAPSVMLSVRKQSGTNTIAVADRIIERISEIQQSLPPGYTLETLRDESATTRTGTHNVQEHLIVGSLLAAGVVLLFLGNFRSTLIAALAIPTSVLGTFAVMSWLGYTLNNITLLALALAVGIVIDDAIVVLENIFRYVEEKGLEPMQAAVEGTREIGLAVLATTLSLIAVFMPVVFISGIPGRFLRSFGVTMSVAIAVSLFVSFTLTPMLASRWLRKHSGHKGLLERLVDTFYLPIERAYMALLGYSMRWRWLVVLLCLVSLATTPVWAIVAKKGFIPSDDRAQFEVVVRLPEGGSIAATEVATERIARSIRDLPEVRTTLVTIADNERSEDNVGRIFVGLVDPAERELNQTEMMEKVRQEVGSKQPPELKVLVGEISDFGGGAFSTARIQYNLSGPDLALLEKYSSEIVRQLKETPGAVDVNSSLVPGKPEVGIRVDRNRAAELGVSVVDVAQALRLMVAGAQVSTYAENGEQYEIRMRAAADLRADPASLALVPVLTSRGTTVPLGELVTLESSSGPSSVDRYNRQRTVNLMANAAPGYGDSEISDAVVRIADSLKMERGYSLTPIGQTKEMKRTGTSVLMGFGLAFVFMYLILAAQFESWVHPFTILLSLPLTLPFAVLSIVITDTSLDLFSALGIFVLFGIVKKNAILQIDHTNQLREHGMERHQAILQANKDRLRPILMTTIAFVAGMIPLVISEGVGSGFNRSTSGVVVGGQTLSLLLTLVATPVFYSLIDDALLFARRLLVSAGLISAEA